jgi:hypothetical protein
VVEHAEEEDDVEAAEPLEVDLHEVGEHRLDAAPQQPVRDVEAGASGRRRAGRRTLGGLDPGVEVERDDARGAAALGLERVEAVVRADVEHGLAAEVRQRERRELGLHEGAAAAGPLCPLVPRRDDAAADVDRVPPEGHGGDQTFALLAARAEHGRRIVGRRRSSWSRPARPARAGPPRRPRSAVKWLRDAPA